MKQQPSQTIESFLQQLETQGKTCIFQGVTTEEKKKKKNTHETHSLMVSLLHQYDDIYWKKLSCHFRGHMK